MHGRGEGQVGVWGGVRCKSGTGRRTGCCGTWGMGHAAAGTTGTRRRPSPGLPPPRLTAPSAREYSPMAALCVIPLPGAAQKRPSARCKVPPPPLTSFPCRTATSGAPRPCMWHPNTPLPRSQAARSPPALSAGTNGFKSCPIAGPELTPTCAWYPASSRPCTAAAQVGPAATPLTPWQPAAPTIHHVGTSFPHLRVVQPQQVLHRRPKGGVPPPELGVRAGAPRQAGGLYDVQEAGAGGRGEHHLVGKEAVP